MFLKVTRQERPWAVCAIFLLFVLVTLYDAKNNPRVRVGVAVPPNAGRNSNNNMAGGRPQGTVKVKGQSAIVGDDKEHDDKNDADNGSSVAPLFDASHLPEVPSSDFSFCTRPYLWLRDTNRTLDIPYQCDGPLYRSFIGQLRTFSDDLVTTGEQSSEWGHRTHLPAGKRYLFLGNSHTRQTAMALLCQFPVRDSTSLESKNKAMARKYDLENGTEVYLVVNSYAVHSPKWVELLEKQIGVALHDFDAVIIGVFNTCNNDDANTTFAKDMKEMEDEDTGVDCINQDGPTLKEVAAVYAGPLAYVSMFATYRYKTYSQDKEDAKVLMHNRTNLLYLDGRQYLRMYGLEECGSANRDALSDCVHGEEARRYHHRCVGRYGGHPDLIAWDVVEFLYKYTQ